MIFDEDDLEPTLEEHEDVMRLIGHAFTSAAGSKARAREKQQLVAGLAAIVKAKYGALEHKRHKQIVGQKKGP